MKTPARSVWLVLAAGIIAAAVPFTEVCAETTQRTVRGTVTATNVTVNPQTIVIRVVLPNREEMIVGARVPADTRITRGKHAASLADVKVGEPADVTYLKTSDGLTARSIHVR
ncbi:MAG TPA: hypothetical protein VKP13_04550 [Nitrospira sp.]|nr:hypothetical protein [Nitrospira sp.]